MDPNIQSGKYGPLVGAVDQGTSSTRFLVFASRTAELITYHQVEIRQIYPKEGWVEEDPLEILESVKECIEKTIEKLHSLEIDHRDIKAIGISNQRETTIVWDKATGAPLHNAIVWLDNRTSDTVEKMINKTPGQNKEYLKAKCGLPISTYFSALKLHWLLEHVPHIQEAVDDGRCLFGTVDSWIIWNLTGGPNGGVHITDVTNASRTMLMDIETLQWDPYLCNFFHIPQSILPSIKSSSEIYGYLNFGLLKNTPISGCLGDQSSALVGQLCFRMGQAKNTYGTGCFLLFNTGTLPVFSEHGLLTTVAYKLGPDSPTFYALEGSVAIAGAGIRWLRDNLGIIPSSSSVEALAASVESEHGLYFVPAFSGLYAPYWDPTARGIICGITQFTTKAHVARAMLMATCFQTREIIDAMNKDSGMPLTELQVDGGMTVNDLLMQLQADILGIPVVRPSMPETTALGAAMAAGAAEGVKVWSLHPKDLTAITTDTFYPAILSTNYIDRAKKFRKWKDAVRRSRGWATVEDQDSSLEMNEQYHMLKILPGGLFMFGSFAMLLLAKNLLKVVES